VSCVVRKAKSDKFVRKSTNMAGTGIASFEHTLHVAFSTVLPSISLIVSTQGTFRSIVVRCCVDRQSIENVCFVRRMKPSPNSKRRFDRKPAPLSRIGRAGAGLHFGSPSEHRGIKLSQSERSERPSSNFEFFAFDWVALALRFRRS
jgi:hypothetical protein